MKKHTVLYKSYLVKFTMQGKIFNFIFDNIAPQSNIFVTGIPTLLNYFVTFQVCKLENNIFLS